MTRATEQEDFWENEFGNEYAQRNRGHHWVAANRSLFANIFSHTKDVQTVLELGSNIGLNLMAIGSLLPRTELHAVEINQSAVAELTESLPKAIVHHNSILEFEPEMVWDFVFTKGVLIHINPTKLPQVYDLMYRCSKRYLLVSEYYNPTPVEVDYRGHQGRLFKRDFAGELLDRFDNLALLDYGFVYHRDSNFPQDDMNWFLLEKRD